MGYEVGSKTEDSKAAAMREVTVLLWPPCVADADIIFLPCGFFYLIFSSPNLGVGDWMSIILAHILGLSANLGCRSETCCTRLAENTGRKKSPKIRYLRTIVQLCRAIS